MDDIYKYLDENGKLKKEKEYKEIKIKKDKKKRLYKLLNSNRVTVIKKDEYIEEEDVSQYDLNKKKTEKRKKELIKNIDFNDNNEYINELINKYSKELEDYKYVNGKDIKKILVGGYIRYINLDGDLKFGGILIRKDNIKKISKTMLVLKNSKGKIWKVSYKRNYIFYKKHTTINDKFRDLFISSIN